MRPPPDPSVLAGVALAERLLVCCDFDGTLSHLVDDPAAARPVPGAVEVLDRLGRLGDTTTAVVSGRALDDLTALCGMPAHVRLVGSHGGEFRSGDVTGLDSEQRELLAAVVAACADVIAGVDGASLEVKPASVAVHVRRCARDDAAGILAAVDRGPARWPGIHVTTGKEVVELSVVRLGKGLALDRLRAEGSASAVLFVGDDITDEDAFGHLRPEDLGVKVGSGQTLARWGVSDPDAVVALLREVLRRRTTAAPAPASDATA